jgi:hypothetical protein
MAWFKSRDLLDRAFQVGIILKGLNGILEIVGGVLLLVVSPETINKIVVNLTQSEFSEDPHDAVAKLFTVGGPWTHEFHGLVWRLVSADTWHRQSRSRGGLAARTNFGPIRG